MTSRGDLVESRSVSDDAAGPRNVCPGRFLITTRRRRSRRTFANGVLRCRETGSGRIPSRDFRHGRHVPSFYVVPSTRRYAFYAHRPTRIRTRILTTGIRTVRPEIRAFARTRRFPRVGVNPNRRPVVAWSYVETFETRRVFNND